MEDFEPTTMLKLFIKYVNSLIVVTLEVSAVTGAGTTQRMEKLVAVLVAEAIRKPEWQTDIAS